MLGPPRLGLIASVALVASACGVNIHTSCEGLRNSITSRSGESFKRARPQAGAIILQGGTMSVEALGACATAKQRRIAVIDPGVLVAERRSLSQDAPSVHDSLSSGTRFRGDTIERARLMSTLTGPAVNGITAEDLVLARFLYLRPPGHLPPDVDPPPRDRSRSPRNIR